MFFLDRRDQYLALLIIASVVVCGVTLIAMVLAQLADDPAGLKDRQTMMLGFSGILMSNLINAIRQEIQARKLREEMRVDANALREDLSSPESAGAHGGEFDRLTAAVERKLTAKMEERARQVAADEVRRNLRKDL